jgi:hypothetical protein
LYETGKLGVVGMARIWPGAIECFAARECFLRPQYPPAGGYGIGRTLYPYHRG